MVTFVGLKVISQTLPFNDEGYIVVDANFNRVKALIIFLVTSTSGMLTITIRPIFGKGSKRFP